MELAQAYVQIIPSADGIKGKISEALGGEAQSAGQAAGASIGANIGGMIKKAIMAAGIGMAIKSAVSEGAELEQSIGGIETLFGAGGAKSVEEYAQAMGKAVGDVAAEYSVLEEAQNMALENASQAYATAGLSANEYMQTITGFAAALKGSTSDSVEAAKVGDMAVRDMADNANKMGSDMASIQTAYAGFAKQNYTMLDNLKLGYGGTKTEMQRLLKDATKLSGIEYNIDNLSDVYQAIHVIQGELGITGTTANEAAGTISGSMASMKAALQNVLGNLAIGEDIMPSLMALGQTIQTFLIGNLFPMIGRILSGLPEIFNSGIVPIFSTLVTSIAENVSSIVEIGTQIVTSLAEAVITALPYLASAALQLITGFGAELLATDWPALGRQLLDGIGQGMRLAAGEIFGASSVGDLLSAFSSAFSTGLPGMITQGGEIIRNIVEGIGQALPDMSEEAGEILNALLTGVLENGPKLLSAGIDAVLNIIQGIVKSLPDIAASAGKVIGELVRTFITHLPELYEQGYTMLGKVIAGIIACIPDLLNAALQLIGSFCEQFADVDWLQLGADIVMGIANGIQNAGGAIMEAALNAAKGAFDTVKSFFHIESPSKLMRDEIGKNIVLGMADGIEDNADSVSDAMLGLSEAGEEGAEAFMEAAKNGLGAVYAKLSESMAIPTESETQLSEAYAEAGALASQGFGQGMAEGSAAILTASAQLGASALAGLQTSLQDTAANVSAEQLGGAMATGLAEGMEASEASVLSGVKKFSDNLYKKMQELFAKEKYAAIGLNISKGIAEGIESGEELVVHAMEELARSCVSAAESILRIGSPSKVFRDEVGYWIPAGIAEGIASNMAPIRNALNEITNLAENAVMPQGPSLAMAGDANFGYVPSWDGLAEALTQAVTSTKEDVTVNVSREGDAQGIFKVVKQENRKEKRATGYSPLA